MREINESYQKHSQANDKFYELHKRFARLTQFVAKGTVISYTGYSSLMVLVQPTIGSYFALGHLTPCMQVYFIGVREYSDFLMNILIVYNLLMCLFMQHWPISHYYRPYLRTLWKSMSASWKRIDWVRAIFWRDTKRLFCWIANILSNIFFICIFGSARDLRLKVSPKKF